MVARTYWRFEVKHPDPRDCSWVRKGEEAVAKFANATLQRLQDEYGFEDVRMFLVSERTVDEAT